MLTFLQGPSALSFTEDQVGPEGELKRVEPPFQQFSDVPLLQYNSDNNDSDNYCFTDWDPLLTWWMMADENPSLQSKMFIISLMWFLSKESGTTNTAR